jgi:hypothetical protein
MPKVWENLEILGRATPDQISAHPICSQPAAVVTAPDHQNNTTTNVRPRAETLLAVREICEQLMRVTSPILAAFWPWFE